MKPRGLFITFEGGEGAGKTTLIEEIARALSQEGHKVIKSREPGGTKLGEKIRNLLLEPCKGQDSLSPYAELALFLASRAQHIREVIMPALEAGNVVLSDRFNDSSIAYQGYARGLDVEKIREVCSFFSQNLEPEFTFYLDIDPEVGLKRAKGIKEQDRIEAESLSFHKKIRQGYLAIYKESPGRFHLLDATLSPQEVFEGAMAVIYHSLKQ